MNTLTERRRAILPGVCILLALLSGVALSIGGSPGAASVVAMLLLGAGWLALTAASRASVASGERRSEFAILRHAVAGEAQPRDESVSLFAQHDLLRGMWASGQTASATGRVFRRVLIVVVLALASAFVGGGGVSAAAKSLKPLPEEAWIHAGPEAPGLVAEELQPARTAEPIDSAWLSQFTSLDDARRKLESGSNLWALRREIRDEQSRLQSASTVASPGAPIDACGAPPAFVRGADQIRVNVVKSGDGAEFLRTLRGVLRDSGGKDWLPWTMEMAGRDATKVVDVVLVNGTSAEGAGPFCNWLACKRWRFSPSFPCGVRTRPK